MQAQMRVTGTTLAELTAAADEAAARFSGGLPHTVTLDDVSSDWRYDSASDRTLGVNEMGAPQYSANATVDINDGTVTPRRTRDVTPGKALK